MIIYLFIFFFINNKNSIKLKWIILKYNYILYLLLLYDKEFFFFPFFIYLII